MHQKGSRHADSSIRGGDCEPHFDQDRVMKPELQHGFETLSGGGVTLLRSSVRGRFASAPVSSVTFATVDCLFQVAPLFLFAPLGFAGLGALGDFRLCKRGKQPGADVDAPDFASNTYLAVLVASTATRFSAHCIQIQYNRRLSASIGLGSLLLTPLNTTGPQM